MHIAVILPERYRGGTLRGAKNIARMLHVGSRAHDTPIKVTFGHIDDASLYRSSDFTDLVSMGIGVRPFQLQTIPADMLAEYYRGGFVRAKRRPTRDLVLFNDGMSNFEDADFWLIISDRIAGAIPPHRRYGVVVYDYIQRYVPAIFDGPDGSTDAWNAFDRFAAAVREADFVLCTTNQTRTDCISYVGVEANRVHVAPMEFDAIDDGTDVGEHPDNDAPYLLWTTNSTQHKNHMNIIDGLDAYFRKHPSSPLKIRMSGVYTHLFTEKAKGERHYDLDYIRDVRRKLAEAPLLRSRLEILGNVSDSQYVQQVRGAHFILHGALYDNGTFSIVEGAWFGIPSISSDYPAMREMSKLFSVPLSLFNPRDPAELATVLHNALGKREELVAALPMRSQLMNHTFEKVAPRYWLDFQHALQATGV